jgi:hypothetical protein
LALLSFEFESYELQRAWGVTDVTATVSHYLPLTSSTRTWD